MTRSVLRLPGLRLQGRGRPDRSAVVVAGVPALVCVADLLIAWNRDLATGVPASLVVGYAMIGCVPLGYRYRYPRGVFATVIAHSMLALLVTPTYVPAFGWWLALYTVAARCRLRDTVVALGAALLPVGVIVVGYMQMVPSADLARVVVDVLTLYALLLAALVGVGRWVRWADRRHEETRRSAVQVVAVERARIARDLHDVVAHSVTLMLLQAGGAARLVRRDPDRAAAALEHVDALGQQALVELRRMLALLRPDDAPAGAGQPSSPSGLANLPSLVDRVADGGLDVRFAEHGGPRDVAPGVDLTLYRIAQEALTNVTRYADPGQPVEIDLRWLDDGVELEVRNRRPPGRRPRTATGGYGLVGMRERVLSVDGQLQVGDQPDGSFLVRARLPAPAPHPVAAGPGAAQHAGPAVADGLPGG